MENEKNNLALENQELKQQLEQTLLVNADLQNHIEEIEVKKLLKNEGLVEQVKYRIPEKSFHVKFEDNEKIEHGDKSGEYIFIAPRFTNPLTAHSLITAEEALTDKLLLKHLVRENCGVVKRIPVRS